MSNHSKLNAIYENYKAELAHGFHSLLWAVMVDDLLADTGEQHALYVCNREDALMLVIAASGGGYLAAHNVPFVDGISYPAALDIAEELSALIWGFSGDDYYRLMGQSMSGRAS